MYALVSLISDMQSTVIKRMAYRYCFISKPQEEPIFQERLMEFTYHPGFSLSQKQKSIQSLHDSIQLNSPSLHILEISSKSTNPLGVKLSAFNMIVHSKETGKNNLLENVFQSSKVFEKGGPYLDLLQLSPRDAKRDERLKTSGRLQWFEYEGRKWELEPKSLFYDWLYINSVSANQTLMDDLQEYNAFTDIEFNHKKSHNCQARSAAILVSLMHQNLLDRALGDIEFMKGLYFHSELPANTSPIDSEKESL